jgi:hypothetical protein
MNKLNELAKLGQSVWLDYISRGLITSGELKTRIANGLRGMTSIKQFLKSDCQAVITDDDIKLVQKIFHRRNL